MMPKDAALLELVAVALAATATLVAAPPAEPLALAALTPNKA